MRLPNAQRDAQIVLPQLEMDFILIIKGKEHKKGTIFCVWRKEKSA